MSLSFECPISTSFALLYDSLQEQLPFRLVHELPVDVLGQHYRVVRAGSARHCNLESSYNRLLD